MIDRAHALLAGVFVVVLGVGIAVLAALLSGHHGKRLPYLVVSRVPVSGLSVQSAVYYRGVPSGTVDSIDIDPSDARRVWVRIQLDAQVPVTAGTFARLRLQLVTGNAELVLDDSFQRPTRLSTSSERPARIPLRSSGFEQLVDLAPKIVDDVGRLAESLERVVAAVRPEEMRDALSNAAAAAAEFRAVGLALHQQLESAPHLARDAARLFHKVGALSDRLATLSAQLQGTAASATRLAQAGEAASQGLVRSTLPTLDATMRELARTARSIEALARMLREQPQSLIQGSALPAPGPGERGYRSSWRSAEVPH